MWWQPGRRKFPAAANGRRQCRSLGNRRGESWGRSGGGSRGRESSGGRDAHDPRRYRQEPDEIDVAEEEKHMWIGGRGWINRLEEGRKGKAPEMCMDDQISIRPADRTHTIMWEADKQCNSKKKGKCCSELLSLL